MTESDPGVASETASYNTPGEPGPASAQSYGEASSVTRRAGRLAVQFDVGELGFVLSSVRNRDHDSRSEQQHLGQPVCGGLGKHHPFQRLIFIGITRAMVGVSSSFLHALVNPSWHLTTVGAVRSAVHVASRRWLICQKTCKERSCDRRVRTILATC